MVDRTKSIDEIWDEVRVFYQKSYKIAWKTKPSEDQIYWLYGEMRKFCRSISSFHQENRGLRDRALRFYGLAEDPTKKRKSDE